ncbi:TRAP-type C4-dicarboxylate transport system, small permease component [Solibacillus isronensis B3W22]|uniref:TRAP-type C4-dicarboxylate transport system, small permease component n=1 Tax=Solibacillus isronensis B3W22 TaxID=1224748 RepID=K1KVS1_9BACL|nr:TRAP transporter small permease subunit [Solibacillus isronensis]AMO87634.1 hypothetical protein SOLI23_19615 [Solibacillus silvestris]EKB43982.1 TRAP-type C4-dicarboxylate transport system, small permease component [Solibacillus isronensis B3W22]
MKKIIKVIDSIIDFSAILASLFIFCICFIVTWGIIAREFHLKIYWVEPFSIYMFIAAAFLTIPYTMKMNEHIRVDILLSKLSPKVAKILDTVLMTFSLVLFLYITKVTYDMFWSSWTMKTKDLSIIQVPIWIPQLFVVVGWSVFVLSIFRYILAIWFEEKKSESKEIIGE